MARSTAPRFITGSVPGSARSTAQACVLGSAPNAVGARLKIFDCGRQLGVRLEADDDFVAVDRVWRLISEALRAAEVEIGGLLEAVRGVQQPAFGEVVADQLQAHRHAAPAPKPQGTLMPGRPASDAGSVKMSAR